MQTALIVIGCLFAPLVLFVWWRYTSVSRGALQRDERLAKRLDKLAARIERGEPIEAAKVAKLATNPELRGMLYHMLEHFERLDLFPANLMDARSQAESRLAVWLMHPNEFGAPPGEIEHVETVQRRLGDGVVGDFVVFRFRYSKGHFAAKDGWLLGMAGPSRPEEPPFANPVLAFCRFGDKFGQTKPKELVDWYIEMAKKKGVDYAQRLK